MLGRGKYIIELERKVAVLEERDREKNKIIEDMQFDLDQQRGFLFTLRDKIERMEKKEPTYMDMD